uniref:Sodium/hydrogen exchanger n=1 Tax=Timema monikensis TaxID=170555 RepID=A0A7R9HMA5_9NEOP|nr:unnamed protein product [Timema monikensis]
MAKLRGNVPTFVCNKRESSLNENHLKTPDRNLNPDLPVRGFHMAPKLSKIFPESCLLIVVGVVIGMLLFHTSTVHVSPLTPDTFFLYMLPPIILDAGYFMPNRLFFDHLGTILLFAVVGTIFNTLTIGKMFCDIVYQPMIGPCVNTGASLWAVGQSGLFGVDCPILDMFLFSALISAVDPVAVLAVFEEIHVNEILYIVVFGESLLNDAVTVVLYHMFEAYSEMGPPNILFSDYMSGLASFFVVAVGGTIIGVVWGFLTALVTRYTHEVRVIEPIFIFVMAYLAYLNAEIFHMSGILAITFCGITMKNYVEANISHKSHTTVKYAMKMLSSSSETIIFMFLGVATVNDSHDWNTWFVVLTIFFCSVFRVLGVILLTAVVNRFRLYKLNKVEKFVMSYGGLRGAVAFALVLLIDPKHVRLQPMFVTTTIAVIYFTVFFQTIRTCTINYATPNRELNPGFPVIGSSVYFENVALDYTATEEQLRSIWQSTPIPYTNKKLAFTTPVARTLSIRFTLVDEGTKRQGLYYNNKQTNLNSTRKIKHPDHVTARVQSGRTPVRPQGASGSPLYAGITIKPLVKILNVKRAEKRKPSMNERIHERIMDHVMAGIEDILGHHGNHHLRDKFKRFDNKFIRPLLIRDHQGAEPKILETYSKLAMKDAMDYMRRNASTIGNISGTESMSAIFRNYTAGNFHGNIVGNLNGSTSFTHLDSSTWNIDMQELEYNPSKKDLTDAKIHHLLAEELCQPYRRHRRLSYSRHAVNDRDLSTQVNYRMHMNIRRMVGERKHHHKRSKKLGKDGKQNHVSFPGITQNGTAKQFSHDYINEVLKEADDDDGTAQESRGKGKEDWDSGIMFTAKSSPDNSRVTTPTATETMLPWKRDDEGESTCPLKQSEFPAWCSNKEYLAYSSPSATFLGGIEQPKVASVIGLFRRESFGSAHDSRASSENELHPNSGPDSPSGHGTVLLIEEGVAEPANSLGIIGPVRRTLVGRRGSMLELGSSVNPIPEEEALTGGASSSGQTSPSTLSERWAASKASVGPRFSLHSVGKLVTVSSSSAESSETSFDEEEEEKRAIHRTQKK